MYDYVVTELPQVVAQACPQLDTSRAAITGHFMGGHGALTISPKNPDQYTLFCFLAHCCANPVQLGQEGIHHYLGSDESTWAEYDLRVTEPSDGATAHPHRPGDGG